MLFITISRINSGSSCGGCCGPPTATHHVLNLLTHYILNLVNGLLQGLPSPLCIHLKSIYTQLFNMSGDPAGPVMHTPYPAFLSKSSYRSIVGVLSVCALFLNAHNLGKCQVLSVHGHHLAEWIHNGPFVNDADGSAVETEQATQEIGNVLLTSQ